jgi:hypothetical protein
MIEHVRMVADYLEDAIDGVNPRLAGATIYRCTDANEAGTGQLSGVVTPAATGSFQITCRIYKGTSAESRILCYRNTDAVQIFRAIITWSGMVPTVTMTAVGGQPAGTLVSSTEIYPGAYELVLQGTVVTADLHLVRVAPASAATSATGTIGCSHWAASSGTLQGDMTETGYWSIVNGATVAAVTWSALDIDTGDSAPGGVTVYDDSRNAIIARKVWPDDMKTTRGLVVYDLGTEWRIGIQNGYQEGQCRTGVLLVIPVAATDEAIEDCGYLMRAVRQALNDLSEPANETDRTRNAIVLTNLQAIEEPPPEVELADVLVMASGVWTWDVRDTAP